MRGFTDKEERINKVDIISPLCIYFINILAPKLNDKIQVQLKGLIFTLFCFFYPIFLLDKCEVCCMRVF